MITLSAENGTYIEYSDKIEIIVEENADMLKNYVLMIQIDLILEE